MKKKKALSQTLSTVIIFSIILGAILTVSLYSTSMLQSQEGEGEFKAAESSMISFAENVEDVGWNLGTVRSVNFNPKYGYLQVVNNSFIIIVNITGVIHIEIPTAVAMFRMPIRRYTRGNNYHSTLYPLGNRSFLTEGASDPVVRVLSVEELESTDTIDVVVMPRVKVLNSSYITPDNTTQRVIRIMVMQFIPGEFGGVGKYLIANCSDVDTRTFSGDNLEVRITIIPQNLTNKYLDYKIQTYTFNADLVILHISKVIIRVW